jgi:hypothetical protein
MPLDRRRPFPVVMPDPNQGRDYGSFNAKVMISVVLEFDDGSHVTVREIPADPRMFEGMTLPVAVNPVVRE